MKNRGGLFGYLALFVVIWLTMAGTALAATSSGVYGSVVNNSVKSGRVYINLLDPVSNRALNYGVSIPDPGPSPAVGGFSFVGVPDGTYKVGAFLDATGNGMPNTSDPFATPLTVTITGGTATTSTDLVITPPGAVTPQPPVSFNVFPTPNGAFLTWEPQRDKNDLLTAEEYLIEWGSDDFSSIAGSKTVLVTPNGNFALLPGISGTYAFRITGKIGPLYSTPLSVGPMVFPQFPSGSFVSGTINLDNWYPEATLHVILAGTANDQFRFASISSPTTSNAFTIDGVPAGNYRLLAFLDLNNVGVMYPGAAHIPDIFAMTVGTNGFSGLDTGITAIPVIASLSQLMTQHSYNHYDTGSEDRYGIKFRVAGHGRIPVNARLISGPGVGGNMDMGITPYGDFAIGIDRGTIRPVSTDSYQLEISYADDPSNPVLVTLTNPQVRDNMPINLAPDGGGTGPAPTFTWSESTTFGLPVEQRLSLSSLDQFCQRTGQFWGREGLSPVTFNLAYDGGSLPDGNYEWEVSALDPWENAASTVARFTVGAAAPCVPASGGGTPAASWTIYSVDPSGPSRIDWPTYQYGTAATGNYLRINGVLYHVAYSAYSSPWNTTGNNWADLQQCDQQTGAVLKDMYNTPLWANLNGAAGQTAELFTVWPGPQQTGPWTVNSIDTVAGIDWMPSQHGAVAVGNYLKIGSTYYYVTSSGTGSLWPGGNPANPFAILQQCDQVTGQQLFDAVYTTQPLYANVSGFVGQQIELFSTWPGQQGSGWVVNSANPTMPPPYAIDWLASQHGTVPEGSYLKINGIYYKVIYSYTASWNGYPGAELAPCDQATGLQNGTYVDVAALLGKSIELFTTFPTSTPVWNVNNVDPAKQYAIDWKASLHGAIAAGNYLKIGSTIYYVSFAASEIGSWSSPDNYWAELQNCDQLSGYPFAGFNPDTMTYELSRPNLNGFAGAPIELYTVWPIAFRANVADTGGNALSGATVAMVDKPAIFTTTSSYGTFELTGIQRGLPFVLKMTMGGFVPTYTANFTSTVDINVPPDRAFNLLTPAQFDYYGNTAGTGMIIGRPMDTTNPSMISFSGASVAAVDKATRVPYFTEVDPDGLFRVRNVPDGVTVEVMAAMPGMVFTPAEFTVHGGAVSMGAVFGTPPPSISGRVTGGAIGLGNVQVNVYDNQNIFMASATTDNTGNYVIYNLASGEYRLSFSTYDPSYLPGWYLNATDFYNATPVIVTAGQTTGGIDVALVKTGTISGVVTDGTSPLMNISVTATKLDSNGFSEGTWNGYPDSNGAYTINGLPAGNYVVQFYDYSNIYITQYYPGTPDFMAATRLTVGNGTVLTDINATMALGAVISGRATDSVGGGLPNIYVTLFAADQMNFINSRNTDSSGYYSFTGLPTGNYKVRFEGDGANYVTTWYNGGTDHATATPVVATAGITTASINATLVPGGNISGRVTSQGSGLNFISVWVYNDSNQMVASTYTGFTGNYTVSGLPAGNYRLRFVTSNVYATTWYGNSTTFAGATPVTVAVGATTTGINIALPRFGTISGRVTDSTGAPIPTTVFAMVYDADGVNVSSPIVWIDGIYTVPDLRPGTYKVKFSAAGYPEKWYDNAATMAAATVVTVADGTNVTGIDGILSNTHPLTVSKQVTSTGSGRVMSSPAGIDLLSSSTSSSYSFPAGTVLLTATPDAGSVFAGWGGACAGVAGPSCTVGMDGVRDVTVEFGALPAVPTLVGPSGDISTTTPTYSWNEVADVTSYDLYTNVGGTTTTTNYSSAVCTAGVCSVTSTAIANGSVVYWAVKAKNAAGASSYSSTIQFKVNILPATPTQNGPSGTVATTTPTYSWNEVAGATSYDLYTNVGGVAVTTNYSSAVCTAGVCTVTSAALANGANVYWAVKAKNPAGASSYSSTVQFKVSILPAAPTQNGPSGTIATTTPTYSWNEVAGATSYDLYTNISGTAATTNYSSAICTAGVCTVTSAALANGANVYWAVKSKNAVGASFYSSTIQFNVSILPATPTQNGPSGTVATTTPMYSWNEVAGATSYDLYTNVGGTATTTNYSSAVCTAGVCTVTSAALANGANVYWAVKSKNAIGASSYSPTIQFKVNLLPAIPSQNGPSGTVATTTPTYSWNEVAGATSYDLYTNVGGAAVTTNYSSAVCTAGVCTVTSTAIANGATVYWAVKAKNAAGTSVYSPTIQFKVSILPATPTQNGPSGTVATTTPTYSWNEVAGATSYDLYTNVGGTAVTTNYSSAVCTAGVCTVTSAALANGANVYWAVKARNAAGASPYSSTIFFKVQ